MDCVFKEVEDLKSEVKVLKQVNTKQEKHIKELELKVNDVDRYRR